jgi:hypothetical protein
VRTIFREYLKPSGSLRGVANLLNGQNVPSPKGTLWSCEGVRYILKTQKYAGDYVQGRQATGRYHRMQNGEIVPCAKRCRKAAGTPIVHADRLPAIVERATFDAAQRKLTENKRNSAPHKSRDYPFRGILICADCGRPMTGVKPHPERRIPAGYICSRFRRQGRTACHANAVNEVLLLATVRRIIDERVLSEDVLAKVATAIRNRKNPKHGERQTDLGRLRQDIANLDRKLDSGAERIFAAPAALVGRLTAKLDEIRKQRDTLAAKLEAASKPVEPDDQQRRQVEALAGVEVLRNLRRSFAEARPGDVRRLLTTIISRIDLRFEHEQQGKKMRHRFVEGTIALRPAISAHLKRIGPSSGT